MKSLVVSVLAFSFLTVPSMAGVLSYVDHPDVPNCTIVGPNAANCENVLVTQIKIAGNAWCDRIYEFDENNDPVLDKNGNQKFHPYCQGA